MIRTFRHLLVYSAGIALLVTFLSLLQYKHFIHDISHEVYAGLLALIFTALGIWMGLRLLKPRTAEPAAEIKPVLNHPELSRRELDVLELIASGMSNQEIADKLFLSLNTVKTHSSNLFLKLDVKRRTQAVQRARELGIIP